MSVSLTISNLDDETYRRLEAEAALRGVDVDVIARELLAKNLPPKSVLPPPKDGKYRDLSHLAGTWSEEEYQEFMAAIADFDRIDPEMWQ